MSVVTTAPATASTPKAGTPGWRHALTRVTDAAQDRLSIARDWLEQHTVPLEDMLDRLTIYVHLRRFQTAMARARLHVRAYAFDHEHRATRLLAWAAATDAVALTSRTLISGETPTTEEQARIELLTNQAALLRAVAETERVRYAARYNPIGESLRRAPATPEIEIAAAVQLDRLCRSSIDPAGRIALLSDLTARLYPTLGGAVQLLHDLT